MACGRVPNPVSWLNDPIPINSNLIYLYVLPPLNPTFSGSSPACTFLAHTGTDFLGPETPLPIGSFLSGSALLQVDDANVDELEVDH